MSAHDHLDEDALLDLVHDLVPADRRETWMAHVRSCVACETALRRHVEVRDGARARADWAMAQLPAPMGRATSASPRRRAWWRPVAMTSAAAAVVAAVLILAWPRGDTTLAVQLERLPGEVELTTLRSGTTDGHDPQLTAGLRAYAAGDDDQAIREFERARPDARTETMRRLYLGSALAHRGRYAEAVEWLRATGDAEIPEPWRKEARWTLCVALFGSGERAAAESLLAELVRDDPSAASRAQSLRAATTGRETGR